MHVYIYIYIYIHIYVERERDIDIDIHTYTYIGRRVVPPATQLLDTIDDKPLECYDTFYYL